jgi:hypothetical protein
MPIWILSSNIIKIMWTFWSSALRLMPLQFNKKVGKCTHEPRSNLNHKKYISNTFACTFIFSTKLFWKYKNILTSLHTQPKFKNIILIAYLLYCIVIYFTILHIIFTFTYIHTLCLTTTRWSWGHKNEELVWRLLEEERAELFWLFPESLILTPSLPRGEIYSYYNTLHLESQLGTLA